MSGTDHADELSALISDLVSIETENPPGNEEQCSEYIVDWFDERGIEVELVEEPYSDRGSACASVRATRRSS